MRFSSRVGARIRYYRNLNKISLQTLAQSIHKSISTVSKYESGQIAIDIDTLYEIADCLQVSIHQLLEVQNELITSPSAKLENHFFLKEAPIYSYYMVGQHIFISVFIPTHRDGSCISCNIFMDALSEESYSTSRFFFKGEVLCFDSGAAILLKNPINNSDHGFIYAKLPYSNTSCVTGLFTFSSEELSRPVSVKVLFSITPIPHTETLRQQLQANSKLALSDLKKKNVFVLW